MHVKFLAQCLAWTEHSLQSAVAALTPCPCPPEA